MQRHTLFIDAHGTLVHLADPAGRLVAAARDRVGVQITEAQAAAALGAEIAHYRAHMDEARDGRGPQPPGRNVFAGLGDHRHEIRVRR
jgi:hypothetical protein